VRCRRALAASRRVAAHAPCSRDPALDHVGGGESPEGGRDGKLADPPRLGMRPMRMGMRMLFFSWCVKLLCEAGRGEGRDKACLGRQRVVRCGTATTSTTRVANDR